ncbi:NAD(P)-binding domain-containing protein [Conexibacter stalactiti]|uniref:NAD(P)-binding domain-containing protein n=1 Tax=Conexibacter stalactiti TaxID=1940611 RepID=A0ABU4HS97_9ACTN|nr:NAD(P)-binding domain-containing protein [Conexibacter stalactiti]MDW5595552.1 NAD(P)-binding domain-containing protein [Conexibacter stalactiti]MEC5036194.1 NAD(P)-binding domain-containing protein [Conexibacter stalactiti]
MSDSTPVRIGIVGVGNIGGALARHFVAAGHEVAVANSRGPETLVDLVAELGERAHAATVAEALRFGEVDVVSIPLGRIGELPADGVAGKVVIDTNNYYPGRDGQIAALDDDSTTSSELLAVQLPGARIVKAFNAIYASWLAERGLPAGDPARLAIPISGDDAEAKRIVAALIDEIGFDAVDAGTLAVGGRKHQPDTPPYGAEAGAAELRGLLGL